MLILRCSSSASSVHSLVGIADSQGWGILFLKPDAARTRKELEAAFYLANEAFAAKGNISAKMANEAMLFLACEMNFTSAAKKVGATDAKDFLLVSEKDLPVAVLKKKLMLAKIAPLKLPEFGKKKNGYTEGELAIERMALARVKN
jgi:tRNA threonylcarbamoyladenosine modification (KEOPS) complex Cgi121 subunit